MGLSLVALGLLLSGTKACQEDYDLGSVSSVPTATPTDDGDDDDDIETLTPTPTETSIATETPDGTETPDATETPDGDPTETPTPTPEPTVGTASLFTQLSQIRESPEGSRQADGQKPQNWLGKIGTEPFTDTDGDGYSDSLEEQSGSDLGDPGSIPLPPSSRLAERLRGIDDDVDGIPNEAETALGTSPISPDSDGDGYFDGPESLVSSDPLDQNSLPAGGAAADAGRYGSPRGFDVGAPDSDGDGLPDAYESSIGSDPYNLDTDSDGIVDGVEIALGSDPVLDDFRQH